VAVPGLRSAGARRIAWVIGDQALSGFSNVAATVVIARSVSSSAFGVFGVGFIVYVLALGLVRGLVSQPLAVRLSAQGAARSDIAGAAGAAVAVGAFVGAVVVVIGVALGDEIGAVLMVVGAFLPALLLQDTWRFVFITVAEPSRAVLVDLVWAALQLVMMGVVLAAGGGLVALVAAWAVAGGLAAGAGGLLTDVWPDVRRALPFLRSHLDLGPWFATEYAFNTGSSQITALVLGGVIGTAGIGAIRGGQTLFGPFHLAMTGLMSAAVSEGSRLLVRSPRRLLPLLRTMSLALIAVAAVWGVALLLTPDAWGRALLGDTWPGARSLVVPLVVGSGGLAAASGGLAGLRILGAAQEGLRVQVVAGTVTFVVGVAGGLARGVEGAVWGLAVGAWGVAAGAWWTLDKLGAWQGTDVDAIGPTGPSSGVVR